MHLLGRLLAVALSVALLAASPATVPTAGTALTHADRSDAAYTALAKEYFDQTFRADPANATAIGVHDYDRQLGSYAAADYAAQIARDHRYLDRLLGLDPATMSARVGLDRRMLENNLRDDLLLNETMELWRHQPDGYVQTAAGGVFVLISRRFAPPASRLRDAIAREEQIPRLFAQARANLTAVDKDTASIAAEDAAGSVDLFATTVPQAFRGVGDAATRARFRRSTQIAVAATKSFAAYLRTLWIAHPAGTFAIGADNYSARLKYEEGIDMPLDQYLAIGERALAQTHAEMVATAKRIDPHATTQQVLSRLYRVHPTSAGLIPAAQADLVKLRRFIVARHIIDLPPDASITVTPTPEFLRATTEASMDSPGPLERVATQAYYNVTPVDPHDKPAIQEQYLQSFNDFERPIVSAHEVYPGHFVNFTIDKHLPLTLSEKLLTATSFVEGWAHYDEQMMVDQGWGNGDPRVKMMQLREAIWRNARYVAGVKMHTQGMTVPQAVTFFETQAFLDPPQRARPRRSAARRTRPTATTRSASSRSSSCARITRRSWGARSRLARFHHDLLQYGDPAIPLLRPLLLGERTTTDRSFSSFSPTDRDSCGVRFRSS